MTIASVPPDGPFLLKFVTRFDPQGEPRAQRSV